MEEFSIKKYDTRQPNTQYLKAIIMAYNLQLTTYNLQLTTYNLRQPPKGLVFHSDRGSQYTSKHYRILLDDFGMRASMGDVGACWDNAVVERFYGSFKLAGYIKLLSQPVSIWKRMLRLT